MRIRVEGTPAKITIDGVTVPVLASREAWLAAVATQEAAYLDVGASAVWVSAAAGKREIGAGP